MTGINISSNREQIPYLRNGKSPYITMAQISDKKQKKHWQRGANLKILSSSPLMGFNRSFENCGLALIKMGPSGPEFEISM